MGKIQKLSSLRVFHLNKKSAQNDQNLGSENIFTSETVLLINTCLRKIWITFDSNSTLETFFFEQKIDRFLGGEAYEFLLRIACGLESEIIGETDIFGQFKTAWADYKKQHSTQIESLQHWIQKLFEDTKEIRTQHIQNIGGNNYGSLVRKMIKERSTKTGRSKPILLVGAGNLAKAILPYLKANEVWVWNRNLRNANQLKEIHPEIKILDTKDKEIFGWKNAAHILICIPASKTEDLNRLSWLLLNDVPRSIIHLGALNKELAHWKQVTGFFALDDIFKLQQEMSIARQTQISHAKKACVEKAMLRVLTENTAIPHGWEDLLHFV